MTDQQLPEAALAALREGNLIQAIKVVREERNIGLRQAKDMVEDYAKTQPDIIRQIEEKRKADPKVVVFIVLLVLAMVFFLAKK